MFDQEIFYKTDKGRAAMTRHQPRLPPRLRTALVLIDGKTPWHRLRENLAALGEPEAMVRALSEQGLVESDHEIPPTDIFSLGQEVQDQGG